MRFSESEVQLSRRVRMVEGQLRGRGISDDRVLKVMGELPRQFFVSAELSGEAYDDNPLDIGQGQTISQPYIVALMSEALELRDSDLVLEVGTGCGYQTAILAELSKWVYSIEVRKALSDSAKVRLGELGVENVSYHVGDGYDGWPEAIEFDKILVAAAADEVPEGLLNQLRDGGRMVIPVGGGFDQRLLLITKLGGKVKEHLLCCCRFVKLIHSGGAI